MAVTTVAINAGAVVGGSDNAFGTSTLSNVTVGGSGTIGVSNRANLGINNLAMTSGGRFSFDLSGATSLTDTQLLVGGNQTGGYSLLVDITGMDTAFGQGSYTLATITGTKAFTGVSINSITAGWTDSTISWSGNNLVLNAVTVPEPGTCVLFGLGSAMVLFGYRRTRRKI